MTYYVAEIRFNKTSKNLKRDRKRRKRLTMLFATLLCVLVLVSTLVMIVPAVGGSDESEVIAALLELSETISELPDEASENPRAADGHRKALCNKINATINQVKAGAYNGSLNKLENDLEGIIVKWVVDPWETDLVEKVKEIIDLILTLGWPVHDIAVVNVTASPTEVYVGEFVYVNVTVANKGTEPETFNVYVYADTETTVVGDEIIVGTMSDITLDPEANTTLSFTWDTAGVAEGTYTISAEVPPVEGEEDTDDNLFINSTVTVSLPLKHDVAVTSVTAPAEVLQGDVVSISVGVANPGDFDETFNVLVTYDATLIGTESVTLASKGSTTVLFIWDTDGVTPDTYTITAEAVLDTDEDLTNNKASTSITIHSKPAPPVASFIWFPLKPVVGEEVVFISTSYDPDGTIISWEWDFNGDGITDATIEIAYWTYDAAGTYTVTLTVTDNDDLTDSASADVTASLAPGSPVASFTYDPFDPFLNQNVTFDASASTPDGGELIDPDSYAWDFNSDGIIDAYGMIVTHAYTAYGNYTVALNVTDSEGLWHMATDIVRVYPRPPTANFTFSRLTPYTDETVTFDATGSYDPDGDIVWYYWSFGDDTYLNATNPIAHNVYVDDGTYTVTLVVSDNEGLNSTVSTIVTVLNRPPFASFTESATTVLTGEAIHFDASGSEDPDGLVIGYVWDFGDGTSAAGVSVSHAYEDDGAYMVTLTVIDDDGAASSISAVETVLNRSPVALFAKNVTTVKEDEVIHFDASESYDPDGTIVNYFWDFGDGINATEVVVDHAYVEDGNYTVTLTVTDDDGASSSVRATVTVEAPAGWPLALLAAIGLGMGALTATLLYALYRRRKRSKSAANPGNKLKPVVTLYVPAKVLG